MKKKLFRAIGLMSGTSIDGIDAALVETDGYDYVRPIAFLPNPYSSDFRARLRETFGNRAGSDDIHVAAVEKELTERHAEIVQNLRRKVSGEDENIDFVGFHGQTILHKPEDRLTIQIGDGALLAKMTGLPVINDFRSADVLSGGHGAPLVPLYHRALSAKIPKPIAIVNIGGVANMTWVGGDSDEDILAFDVGPGNALIDDWVLKHKGQAFDEYGLMAASGKADSAFVENFLAHPFFKQAPPKSLDRDTFKSHVPSGMSAVDGAATLTMISARAIALAITYAPQKPRHLYITGGGRLNNTLMRWIADLAQIPVNSVDDLGWSGDGLEAEAFAYLAVRSHLGLPLSVPGTTGVKTPMTGGKLHKPQ